MVWKFSKQFLVTRKNKFGVDEIGGIPPDPGGIFLMKKEKCLELSEMARKFPLGQVCQKNPSVGEGKNGLS